MQNVFYKVKYKDCHNTLKNYTSDDINEATKFYNTISKTNGVNDIKFYVVNNVEEELTKEQLPKIQ